MPAARRLPRLPFHDLPGGLRVAVADSPRARLAGLMGLRALDRDHALLIPRCRSVHTFAMRFPIDLIWLDAAGRVLRRDAAVAPGRLRGCRRAYAVVEAPAGSGHRVATALAAASGEGRLVVGLAGAARPAR